MLCVTQDHRLSRNVPPPRGVASALLAAAATMFTKSPSLPRCRMSPTRPGRGRAEVVCAQLALTPATADHLNKQQRPSAPVPLTQPSEASRPVSGSGTGGGRCDNNGISRSGHGVTCGAAAPPKLPAMDRQRFDANRLAAWVTLRAVRSTCSRAEMPHRCWPSTSGFA